MWHWFKTGAVSGVFLLGVLCQVMAATDVDRNYENAVKSFQRGDIEETHIHLKNALKAAPEHVPSRVLLAEVLIAQGDGEGAEVELGLVRGRELDKEYFDRLLGKSYLLQRKYDALLEEIRPGQRSAALESDIRVFRAMSYTAQNRYPRAKQSFESALALNPSNRDAKLGLAQLALLSNQPAQAQKLANEVLELNPYETKAMLLLSQLASMSNRPDKAISFLDKALNIEPQNFALRLARAGLMLSGGKLDIAEQDVDVILDQIPNEPRARYLKALIKAASNNHAQAQQHFEEAAATLSAIDDKIRNENPGLLNLAANISLKLGHLEAARKFIDEYLSRRPQDLQGQRLLANIRLQMGNPQEAKRILLDIQERTQSKDVGLYMLLGEAALASDNPREAISFFEQAHQLKPGPRIELARARALASMSRFDDALNAMDKARSYASESLPLLLNRLNLLHQAGYFERLYEEAKTGIERFGKGDQLLIWQGMAQGKLRQTTAAKQSFEQALSLNPDNLEALTRLAKIDLANKVPAAAISRLKAYLEREPESVTVLLALGDAYRFAGEDEEALRLSRKALDLQPQNIDAMEQVAGLLAQAQDLNAASLVVKDYLSLNPEQADAQMLLGRLLMRQGKGKEALAAYRNAVRHAENQSVALIVMANAMLELNDIDGAKASLKRAIAWDATFVEAYIALARIALSEKDWQYAQSLIKQIKSLQPDNPQAHLLQAQWLERQGKTDQAVGVYRRELQRSPSLSVLMGLNRLLKSQGKYQESIKLLNAWEHEQAPGFAVTLALASSFKLTGQLDKAEMALNGLLKRYPEQPAVLNNLAQVHIEQTQFELALQAAKKAHELVPGNIQVMDTLGWVYTLQNKFEMALPLFRQALLKDYSNSEIQYHLAVALKGLKRDKEAYDTLSKSLQSGESFEGVEKARMLLNKWKSEVSVR